MYLPRNINAFDFFQPGLFGGISRQLMKSGGEAIKKAKVKNPIEVNLLQIFILNAWMFPGERLEMKDVSMK